MCNGFGAIISKKVKNVAWDEYKKVRASEWDDMISRMSKITGYVPKGYPMKTMSNKAVMHLLREKEACQEARTWVEKHGGNSSELWRDCVRGDWMAWIIARNADKFGITKPQLVGALADCAALSLKFYEKEYPKDKRVRDCINTCRKYTKGQATDEELGTAAYAAYDAAYDASAAYASAASAAYAYAAASAAYAANASAAAAAYASAAANAAYAAAAYAAKTETLEKCADIFRKHFPNLFSEA